MPYFMQFDSSMKAIRPTDNTRLRMPTHNGDIEAHIYFTKFHQIGPPLVAVPATDDNFRVLGLDPATHTETSRWIVPPFPLMSIAFQKGGPFIRDGKLSDDWPGFTREETAVVHGDYRPGVPGFVPTELDYPLDVEEVDTTDWTIKIWVGGQATRKAEPEERNYQLVPWTWFPLGDLDLWLEQYRCFHLGLDIPTALSYPEEDIDADRDEHTTDAGMKTTVVPLDESAGDDAGKHTMYAQVLVDSDIDKAVAATQYYAHGYFLEGVLKYWQHTNQVDPELELDSEGDGIGITGQPEHVRTAREKLNTLPTSAEDMQALVDDIEAAGIDLD